MLRSFLIGLVAGQRGMTPLAVVATATRNGSLPSELPAQGLLKHPVVAAGAAALAAAEMVGDKMKSAPDRIVPIGLATRAMTAAYAGAALAPATGGCSVRPSRSGRRLPLPISAGACAARRLRDLGRRPPASSRTPPSSQVAWR